MNRPNLSDRQRRALNWLGYLAMAVVGLAVLIGAFVGTVMVFGLLSAVVYWIMFVAGATWIWCLIFFFGPTIPKSGRGFLGLLHVALMQFATGGSVLVQDGDSYELGVLDAEEKRIYFRGEWHDCDDAESNVSMMAWQPFSTVFWKSEENLASLLADSEDGASGRTQPAAADGGVAAASDPLAFNDDAGEDDEAGWEVDLKALFNSGVRDLCDISILEKTEEVTERKQTSDGRLGGWEPIIATAVGLTLGIGTGYVVLIGF